MPRLMLIMLCSGFFHLTFATRRLRFFHMSESADYKWSAAQEYCETNHNASLVTVYDEEDAKFIKNYTELSRFSEKTWLGLYHENQEHNENENETFAQPRCSAFLNKKLEWSLCSDKKWFMCNESNNHTVHNISKNWCQARQHCRRNFHADLASEVEAEEKGEEKGRSFWIKGREDGWEDRWSWRDKGCSLFRKWYRAENISNLNCTRANVDEKGSVGLADYGCGNNARPFCSSGGVRIKVIDEEKSWEEAYNYCKSHHDRLLWIRDDRDQEAVIQWLDHSDSLGDRFWIGLRQSRVFGFWIWSSDTTVGESYQQSNWKSGKAPELPMSHHCGLIHRADKKWADEDCSWPLPFLCEEDIEYMDT